MMESDRLVKVMHQIEKRENWEDQKKLGRRQSRKWDCLKERRLMKLRY